MKSNSLPRDSSWLIFHDATVPVRDHGSIAPWAMLFDLSGIARSGSISSL